MSSHLLRRQIPLTIVSVLIIAIFADYFLALPKFVSDSISGLQRWTIILSAFALVLGLVNLFRIHSPRVLKQSIKLSDRVLSAWLLVILATTFVVGITLGTTSKEYSFIFLNVFQPISITFLSVAGLYYCAAIYKSFRARSLEAVVLFVAGFLAITRNVPALSAVAPWWESFGSWIMDVPAVAGMRGMVIGVGVGVVAMGIRMLLQMERRSVTGEA